MVCCPMTSPTPSKRSRTQRGLSGCWPMRSSATLKRCSMVNANRRLRMHPLFPPHHLLALGLLLLALAGCANTPPTQFYVLPSLASADTAALSTAANRDLTIGVGPVTMPPYLDRPQIVTNASRAKLTLAAFDHWASPLHDIFSRALAENLSLLIPTDRVVLHPWSRSTEINYQVVVEVTRFDGPATGAAVLTARWSILDANGKELAMRKSSLNASAGRQDYEAMVTAMSHTLEGLSRDIATTLLTVAPKVAAR